MDREARITKIELDLMDAQAMFHAQSQGDWNEVDRIRAQYEARDAAWKAGDAALAQAPVQYEQSADGVYRPIQGTIN